MPGRGTGLNDLEGAVQDCTAWVQFRPDEAIEWLKPILAALKEELANRNR